MCINLLFVYFDRHFTTKQSNDFESSGFSFYSIAMFVVQFFLDVIAKLCHRRT